MMKYFILFLISFLLFSCSSDDNNGQSNTNLENIILTNLDAPILIAGQVIERCGGVWCPARGTISCGYLSTIDGEIYCDRVESTDIFCITSGYFITRDASQLDKFTNGVTFSNDNPTSLPIEDANDAVINVPIGVDWNGEILNNIGGRNGCGECPPDFPNYPLCGFGAASTPSDGYGVYYLRAFVHTEEGTTYSPAARVEILL